MHVKTLLDFGSKEWETLYLAISELIPPKDVNADISNATFNMAVGAQYNEQFPKDGSVHHVANESDFMFGSWFPLNTMTTFCGVFMAKDGSLYYFGDSHVAKNIMEIKDNDWTVLGHHYPVAPVNTYFQLAAFLLFFTGQNELLNQRLEALFPFIGHGLEVGDPQPMTSELIDVVAVAETAQWETISSHADESSAEDAAIPIPLTNLERLQQLAADMVDSGVDVVQEQSRTGKTVIAGSVVGLMALAGYGLYRACRG